jgi:Na+-transporting NADH:ubiquinone oxidoreductase subunit NqrB
MNTVNIILTEQEIHIVSSLFIFAAAVIPIYLTLRIKTKNLRTLMAILSSFIVVHGAFHITGTLGMSFLSESILEPISYMVLISFGIYYLNLLRKKIEVRRKHE